MFQLFQWALHLTKCEWYAFLYASFRASTATRLSKAGWKAFTKLEPLPVVLRIFPVMSN